MEETISEALSIIRQLKSELDLCKNNTDQTKLLCLLMLLRKTQRQVQLTVETDKDAVQRIKNEAEVLATDKEALEYSQAAHSQEIEKCRDLNTHELNLLGIEIAQEKETVIQQLRHELQQRNELKGQLVGKQKILDGLKATNADLESKIDKLGKLAKAAETATLELQETCGVSLTQEYQQLMRVQQLPEPLFYVYSKFSILPVALSIFEIPPETQKHKKKRGSVEEGVRLVLDSPLKEYPEVDWSSVFPLTVQFTLNDTQVFVTGKLNAVENDFFHSWVSAGEEQPYAWAQNLANQYLVKPAAHAISSEFILEKLEEAAIIEAIKSGLTHSLFVDREVPGHALHIAETTLNSLQIPLGSERVATLELSMAPLYPLEVPTIKVHCNEQKVDVGPIVQSVHNSVEGSLVDRARMLLPTLIAEVVNFLQSSVQN